MAATSPALPDVGLRTPLLTAAVTLLVPAAVLFVWAFGVRALGAGWPVVVLMVPLAGVAALGGQWLVLCRPACFPMPRTMRW